ncbi:MAG: hypothetical protein GY941_16370 [Planctomycetes bacterium]|nr:hypothetical protein [Planctomycetota bacterium]
MLKNMTDKALGLQEWIKEEFPTKEDGMHVTGYDVGHGFVTIGFMDNNKGVWVILCAGYDSEKGDYRSRVNIGTYKSKEDIEGLLAALKGE